jgi:hypothetical protein
VITITIVAPGLATLGTNAEGRDWVEAASVGGLSHLKRDVR